MLVLLSSVTVRAQGESGGVSSNVTGDGTGNHSATGNSEKPLPWKFLASPMGVLSSATWDPVNKVLGDCKNDPQKCVIPSRQLEQIFSATIGEDLMKAKPGYVVIHVVTYDDQVSDDWYLYRSSKGNWGDPRWDYQKFTRQRIYGSRSVFFLFVHVNTRAMTLEHAREQLKQLVQKARADYADAEKVAEAGPAADAQQKIITELQAKQWDDANVAKLLAQDIPDERIEDALQTLKAGPLKVASTELRLCDGRSGYHFQWFGDVAVPEAYTNVRYEAAVVRRTPANIDNLKKILGLLFGAQSKTGCINIVPQDSTDIWGTGRIEDVGLPSDISIAGYAKQAGSPLKEEERGKLQIGTTGSYNDEQLYWWDASIGIPVHKIKDLQYSDSNNTVTASQVSKQSAYAMFNLMLHPVDLSDARDNIWPRILVGFPLASSPWDKLFAGGAIGLPLKPFRDFQFFAGSTFVSRKQPRTLTAGSSANNAQLQNDLTLKTSPKFTFGINVPVKSVIDKLK